jgi:hypothetical protein
MQFDIHTMDEKAPLFIRSVLRIDSLGYDCDYISDRQLAKVRIEDGRLVTEGGTRYKALIIPSGTTIDSRLKQLIDQLRPYVIQGENAEVMAHFAKAEAMKSELGLRAIRRKNPTGYHYFIANLTPRDVSTEDSYLELAVPFRDALWFNALNGEVRQARIKDGKLQIELRSGESMILQTFDEALTTELPYLTGTVGQAVSKDIVGPWTLSFIEEAPKVGQTYQLERLQTWEALGDSAAVTMGTGVYTTTFRLSKEEAQQPWQLDLGDVRESARVYINGQFIGCAWAVPYILDCGKALKTGKNTLRIEVTNLPANRIADMDRRQIPWRKMKEINVVDINYQKTTYDQWEPMPSGLNSAVRLIRFQTED